MLFSSFADDQDAQCAMWADAVLSDLACDVQFRAATPENVLQAWFGEEGLAAPLMNTTMWEASAPEVSTCLHVHVICSG